MHYNSDEPSMVKLLYTLAKLNLCTTNFNDLGEYPNKDAYVAHMWAYTGRWSSEKTTRRY